MSKISFMTDGYKLAGNLFMPGVGPKKLAFLFIQGWMGHQNIQAAQALTDLGFATMTYDMRGNGDSEGNIVAFTRADFINDAVVAYDYFRQQVGAETAIGVLGSSFGSYTAVLLSARRDVYALSLRVPANYSDEGYNQPQLAQLGEWRRLRLNYTENRAFKTLHDFKGAVQIIEAGADEVVPSQSPQSYADAVTGKAKLTYEIMQGAPHRLANEQLQAEYEKLLVAWVLSL